MNKKYFFTRSLTTVVLSSSLFLVGCNAMQGLFGQNDQAAYNDNQPMHSNQYKAKNMDASKPKTEVSKAKAKASNAAAQASNTASSSSNSVAPKASAAAGTAMDSPVVPTMTPAVQ